MVTIVTSDNQRFVLEKDIAAQCGMIADFAQDDDSVEAVPLPNVTSNVMMKVIAFCEHHRGEPVYVPESERSHSPIPGISEWDQRFIQVDQEMLFEIILAANYLNIKPLLDVGCKTVANMIKGKTPEEIRTMFNLGTGDLDQQTQPIQDSEGELVQ